MTPATQITYLFDPLCGWCYGAGPALDQLASQPGLVLDLAPTGLFAGPGARAMDAQFAAYAWANDQRIARLSGQAFSEAYRQKVLADTGRLFDSGPATLALTAVALTNPDRTRDALKAIQHARYVDGQDITDTATLARILTEAGLAEAADRLAAQDAALVEALRARIATGRTLMREMGAEGVPALVVGTGPSRRLLPASVLFGGTDALRAALAAA